MRIIFLAHDYVMYGASRSLLNLLLEFKQRSEIELKVLCPKEGDFTNALLIHQIQYEVFPFFNATHVARGLSWVKSIERQFKNLSVYQRLKKAIIDFSPDIIHSNSSILHIGAYLAYDLKIPHVWHIREFGMKDYQMKFDFGRRNFEKWLNRAAAIIAISQSIQKDVLYHVQAPIHQIYNGVFSQSDLQGLSQEKAKAFTFCLVGGLYPQKKQDEAIRAFIQLRDKMTDAQLWLVGQGDGQYEQSLKSLADDVAGIRFWGHTSSPLEVINQCHVGLMCSQHEAMGRVTVEYMACGLPVIGYDNAGTAELIEHGVNGYLYQTIDGLGDRMLELYEDHLLREELGENARRAAFSFFTQEVYANEVYKVMLDVL